MINAVMLGAIAGTGILPISAQALENAIKGEGKAVDANLRGFAYGLSVARGDVVELKTPMRKPAPVAEAVPAPTVLERLRDRIARDYPAPSTEIVMEGAARVFDYQDENYARLYLDRMDRVLAAETKADGDYSATREAGRHLALWMTYEDVIRVAQIKTRTGRIDHVRKGSGAKDEQPVIVTEFLKPGLDEFSSLMPAFIARPLLGWAERTGRRDKFNIGLHIRTNTIFGFALLRMMAAFKPLRRSGYRYGVEQALIERWLAAIEAALPHDTAFAREIAETARLIKGYSDTHRRGTRNFQRLFEAIVDPTLAAVNAGPDVYANAAAALATARKAALADPEGDALDKMLMKLGRVAAA